MQRARRRPAELPELGGELARFDDLSQQIWAAHLAKRVAPGSPLPWVELSDPDGDGVWTLGDGTEPPYVGWTPDQPDGDGACARLDHRGLWDDAQCASAKPVLCRAPQVMPL